MRINQASPEYEAITKYDYLLTALTILDLGSPEAKALLADKLREIEPREEPSVARILMAFIEALEE